MMLLLNILIFLVEMIICPLVMIPWLLWRLLAISQEHNMQVIEDQEKIVYPAYN